MTEPKFPFGAWGTELPKEIFDYLPDDMRQVEDSSYSKNKPGNLEPLSGDNLSDVSREQKNEVGSSGGFCQADQNLDSLIKLVSLHANAAIMDYHNNQVSSLFDTITDLKCRLQKLEDSTLPRCEKIDQNCSPESDKASFSLECYPETVLNRRIRIETTCDAALFELFEFDRISKGYTLPQMIDHVFSRFYGLTTLTE